ARPLSVSSYFRPALAIRSSVSIALTSLRAEFRPNVAARKPNLHLEPVASRMNFRISSESIPNIFCKAIRRIRNLVLFIGLVERDDRCDTAKGYNVSCSVAASRWNATQSYRLLQRQ